MNKQLQTSSKEPNTPRHTRDTAAYRCQAKQTPNPAPPKKHETKQSSANTKSRNRKKNGKKLKTSNRDITITHQPIEVRNEADDPHNRKPRICRVNRSATAATIIRILI